MYKEKLPSKPRVAEGKGNHKGMAKRPSGKSGRYKKQEDGGPVRASGRRRADQPKMRQRRQDMFNRLMDDALRQDDVACFMDMMSSDGEEDRGMAKAYISTSGDECVLSDEDMRPKQVWQPHPRVPFEKTWLHDVLRQEHGSTPESVDDLIFSERSLPRFRREALLRIAGARKRFRRKQPPPVCILDDAFQKEIEAWLLSPVR